MTNTTNGNAKKAPAFIAYHVPDREGADWIRIGAAWPHQDGEGFTVDLDLVPMQDGSLIPNAGRFNLRVRKPKQEAGA